MAGRRSISRDTCKKSVPLEKRKFYYSYKIFTEINEGTNVLSQEQIESEIWYTNPSHSTKVKRYIGIAVSLTENKINFILQIDCLDDIEFGDNNSVEDVENFVNDYLSTYINIISLSYLLNMNKTHEVPEV